MTKPDRKALFFSLAISLLTHSAYGAPPSKATPNVSRKVAAAEKPAKKIIRAQSPDTDESEESFFDAKLTPAGLNEVCIPASPNALNPWATPDLNQTNTPATNAPTNFGSLNAGQGSITAQNNAPAFFGDFFNAGGSDFFVPGAPIPSVNGLNGTTPFAIAFGATRNGLTPPDLDYFRTIEKTRTGPFFFQTSSGEGLFRGLPIHIQNNDITFRTIPGTNVNGTPLQYQGGYVKIEENVPFRGSTDDILNATETNDARLQNVLAVSTNATIDGTNTADSNLEVVGNGGKALVYSSGPVDLPLFILTQPGALTVYSPSLAAGGPQKLVDNASPLPRDRVFFNYNYFHNTPIIIDGKSVSVNRLTPGFEKTFFNDRMSIEVRVPFATTVDNVIASTPGATNTSDIKLGNQTTYLKGMLYGDPSLSITGGIGVQLPTAGDTSYSVDGYQYTFATNTIVTTAPQEIVHVKNEAVHLLPFLGAVYTPNDHFFAQAVAQFDFATGGNAVTNAAQFPLLNLTTGDITSATTGLVGAGSLTDTDFMYLSANAGYWMYKVNNPNERGLTGFAPTAELHYNQSLGRQDVVAGYYGNTTNGLSNVSVVNGVIGANAVFGHNKYVSVGYVAPFTSGTNRMFDGELRVMFNYYFGASRVNSRFSNVPSM